MGKRIIPFDKHIDKVAVSGTNTFELDPIDPGHLACFQRVVVTNKTSAYTRLRLIRRLGARDSLEAQEDSPAAATPYWTTEDIHLSEGMQLVAELTGCTAADALEMNYRGFETIETGGK